MIAITALRNVSQDPEHRPRRGMRDTYALLPLAVRKTLSMCQSFISICETITDGRYTPDEARAAPKRPPAPTVASVLIVGEEDFEDLSMTLAEGEGFGLSTFVAISTKALNRE